MICNFGPWSKQQYEAPYEVETTLIRSNINKHSSILRPAIGDLIFFTTDLFLKAA